MMANRARDDDFKIDFVKHGKELSAAMEADERYWRENDAKFRAVNQKVGSYDEFRDIVKASHLKPLEKGDKIKAINERFYQPWNACANKKDGNEITTKAGTVPDEFTAPRTSLEFARDWKRLPNDDDKFRYITLIPVEHLQQLFQNDTGFGLMGEIIVVLSKHDTIQVDWTVKILKILSVSDRFSLSLQFMSSSEKDACKTLINRLKSENSDTGVCDEIENLAARYCVNT